MVLHMERAPKNDFVLSTNSVKGLGLRLREQPVNTYVIAWPAIVRSVTYMASTQVIVNAVYEFSVVGPLNHFSSLSQHLFAGRTYMYCQVRTVIESSSRDG